MYVIRRRDDAGATYQDASWTFQSDIEKARQYNPIERAVEALRALETDDFAYYDICVYASPEAVAQLDSITPMNCREIRKLTGLSQQKFGAFYKIPWRTIQDWETGKSKAPDYTMFLLERCVRHDFKKD